jgi:hypothetical protein
LGLAVAVGGLALGERKVEKSEAFYAALEDSPQRLQGRLEALLKEQDNSPGKITPPPGLYLLTSWPRLDEGGLEMLEQFLEEHPGVRLVMIDTFARIRPRSKGKRSELGLYDEDYRSLEGLQSLAQKSGRAILVTHHLRKAEAEDPLDMISGTTGLGAVVDTAWVIRRGRGEADAELFITGRDVEEQDWALRWDLATRQWVLLGPAEEYEISQGRRQILEILEEASEPLKPKEIAEALGQPVGNVKKLLYAMLRAGLIKKEGYGLYKPGKGTPGGAEW